MCVNADKFLYYMLNTYYILKENPKSNQRKHKNPKKTLNAKISRSDVKVETYSYTEIKE